MELFLGHSEQTDPASPNRLCFGTTTREEEDISLEGQVVPRKDTFRYLGSVLQRDGDIDEDVSHRIKAG